MRHPSARSSVSQKWASRGIIVQLEREQGAKPLQSMEPEMLLIP